MTAPNSKIEICGASNRVRRDKPRALKPYMTDNVWEGFCDKLDDAMKPWVTLTRISSRIARALGGMFLIFSISYLTLKVFKLPASGADITAYVLFPILVLVVTGATCWLLHVLPKTNSLVLERIEEVLEETTQQINQHIEHTTITMKYQEDEVHPSQGKSMKWIQVRIVNENGESISGDDGEEDLSENDGCFALV